MYKVNFKNSVYGQCIYCNKFSYISDKVLVRYEFREVLFNKYYGTPNIKKCLKSVDINSKVLELKDSIDWDDTGYLNQYKYTKLENFVYYENQNNSNIISIEKFQNYNYEDYKFQHEYELENSELRKKLELEIQENNKALEFEIQEIKSKYSNCTETKKPWWKLW